MSRRTIVTLAAIAVVLVAAWWFTDALWQALLAMHGRGRHGGGG